MPDDDRLPRRVRRQWRQVTDAVEGRHDFETVADRIEKALAATLRNGVAVHLYQLSDALHGAPADRSALLQSVLASLPRQWVTGLGRPFVAEAELLANGVRQSSGLGSDDDVAGLLADGLARTVWQQCFGPVEPRAVPHTFHTYDEFHAYAQRCIDMVRFDRFVDQLQRQVPPLKIRAPRNQDLRKSTKELLHDPV